MAHFVRQLGTVPFGGRGPTPSDTRTTHPQLPWETCHPAVPAVCLGGVALLGMLLFHPVYVCVSLLGALAFALVTKGARAIARKLAWMVPLLVLVSVANPLFSASGSTEVGRVGVVVIYAESLWYGACMGAMMAGSLLWLEAFAQVVTPDKVLATAGRALPTVSLMTSMAAGLVPQLIRQGTAARDTLGACTCGRERLGVRETLARGSTMLVSWALEDSLERADAMRARGWEAGTSRASWRTYRLSERDLLALAGLVLLVAASALLGQVALEQWRFYPTMPRLVAWWGYAPFVALALLPSACVLAGRWHERAVFCRQRAAGGEGRADARVAPQGAGAP